MSAVEAVQEDEPNAWWTTLKHQGVLLSPIILEEIFSDGPPEIDEREYESLRRSYKSFRNDPDELYDWLDVVLEDLLGHSKSWWTKETNVPAEFRRGDLRPNRVLLDEDDEARAMVWFDTDRVTDDDGEPGRIGIYSGKRTYAKLVRLLRETGTEIGILTNGHQFRVVHATLDHESWTEWDAQAWFQGGEGRRALRGFYGLLSDDVLPAPTEDEEDSLLGRIKASRDRQADLSDVMGTQVREAVELLLQDLDAILMEMSEEDRQEILAPLSEQDLSRRDELRARYQAAIRIVMRLVVALYAESRELFPKDNPVYYNSYSVEGLFRDLREARIEEGEDALEKQFSAWPRLQALSRLVYHGSPHSDVPLRAYGGRLFRPPGEDEDDDVLAGLEVFEDDAIRLSDATILEVLEKLKIAEFNSGGQRRTGPVDFSDLRTEYIGMMYEGLLDYELREASEDDGAIVFLNIGNQPALPFNVIEDLDDDQINTLIDNLKGNNSGSFLGDEEVSEADFDQENADTVSNGESDDEFEEDLENRVYQWSKRVVEETQVFMPHHNTVRAMDPTTKDKYETRAAKRVIDRIIRPGGTYLVSHSGNRKSTGTFYTPPELAVPTVQRTLEPLAYSHTNNTKTPRTPEEILELEICDPAMGSGTFPVAALRYLTEALKDSFEEHVFPEVEKGEPIASPLGETAKGYLNERLLDIQKGQEEDWQNKLEIQLKRTIVERCIYGVDINPLAVELGKLSLWIETLNPNLPFTFLDHKIKTGNSLIGTSIQEFDSYPIGAWSRGGGDGRSGENTKKIKEFRDKNINPSAELVKKQQIHETHWFEEDETTNAQQELAEAYNNLHKIVDDNIRSEKYQQTIIENKKLRSLKEQMDRWCALWFWPLEKLEAAPSPEDWGDPPSNKEKEIIENIKSDSEMQFFHWELEFPDVFANEEEGFDAVIGNPPWDIVKPQSREWFQRYIPHARALKRREFNRRKSSILESHEDIASEWAEYRAKIKARKHWIKNVGQTDSLLSSGSKINEIRDFSTHGKGNVQTSKAFVSQSLNIAQNVGMLLPSSVRFAQRASKLREACSERGLAWVATIENRSPDGRKAFDADFDRFSIIICHGSSQRVRITRPILDYRTWRDHDIETITVGRKFISEFSPELSAFPPLYDQNTADTILKICKGKDRIFDIVSDGRATFGREYDPTDDADKFTTIDASNERFTYGPVKEKYLPVVEGKDFWLGKVRGQSSNDMWPSDFPSSNDWIEISEYRESRGQIEDLRLVFRNTGNCQMERSFCPGLLPNWPMKKSSYRLMMPSEPISTKLEMAGIMQTHSFDFVFRRRIDANHNVCFVREQPLPSLTTPESNLLSSLMASLILQGNIFVPYRYYLNEVNPQLTSLPVPRNEKAEEIIRANCEAVVAEGYDLDIEELEVILCETEDPRSFRLVSDDLKSMCISAYRNLKDVGITEFSSHPWKIPNTADTHSDWEVPPTNDDLRITTEEILSSNQMKALDRAVNSTQDSFSSVWKSLLNNK